MDRHSVLLRKRVMGRVFRFWLLRHTVPLLITELIVGWVGLTFLANYIFVEKVVSNALTFSVGNPLRLMSYAFSAFFATNLLNQAIVIICGAALLLMLRNINRSIIEYVSMKRNLYSARSPEERADA